MPCPLSALKEAGGVVHYYEFEYARKRKVAIEKVVFKVFKRLQALNVAFNVTFGRIVRTTGPNWYQVVLDVYV
jgi:tRNA G37 N-methylase Trm5